MDSIVAGEGTLSPIAGHDGPLQEDEGLERTLAVSSWMMILGTVRLICAFGGYVGSFFDSLWGGGSTLTAIGRFMQENPPVAVVVSGWPLVLGLCFCRSRSRPLLLAAALTFFILSLGGALGVVARWMMRTELTVIFGSFEVSLWGLRHLNPASLVQAVMGSIQLALELGTAVAAWSLAQASHGLAVAGASVEQSRCRLHGRLALYVSLAFLVLNVSIPFWSAYEEVLRRSTFVREFVLKTDGRPYARYRGGSYVSPSRRALDMELEHTFISAARLAAGNQDGPAREAYLQLFARAESMGHGAGNEGELKARISQAHNNFAWMLVTCKNPQMRKPQEALTHAKRAVELASEEGNYWNTLGVVWFRLENWTEAIEAFEQSMKRRDGGEGDSFDWFFLAMIEARRGHKEQGRQWYDRAVAWSQQSHGNDPELFRFQVEAAEVLGLGRPPEPEITKSRRRPMRVDPQTHGPA